MEHVLLILAQALVAAGIVGVANAFFAAGWGLLPFLAIWAILFVLCYGGFLILDGDMF